MLQANKLVDELLALEINFSALSKMIAEPVHKHKIAFERTVSQQDRYDNVIPFEDIQPEEREIMVGDELSFIEDAFANINQHNFGLQLHLSEDQRKALLNSLYSYRYAKEVHYDDFENPEKFEDLMDQIDIFVKGHIEKFSDEEDKKRL